METTIDNINSSNNNTPVPTDEFYNDLAIDMMNRADGSSIGGTDSYIRTRNTVVGMLKNGQVKKGYLLLQNYLANKRINEAKDLEVDKVFRILAEQETPVITKAHLLNLVNKRK